MIFRRETQGESTIWPFAPPQPAGFDEISGGGGEAEQGPSVLSDKTGEKSAPPASLSARSAAFLRDIFIRDYGWLNNRLRRKLGCPFNAEDIAAETFAQLAAKPAPEDVREPRALLTTIAQRLVYDMWRRRDLERAYIEALANVPEDLHPSPEDLAVALGTLAAIDHALSGLSQKARAAFIYSQFDGLTYAEIAVRLKVSPSMVRQYIAKALQVCFLAAS